MEPRRGQVYQGQLLIIGVSSGCVVLHGRAPAFYMQVPQGSVITLIIFDAWGHRGAAQPRYYGSSSHVGAVLRNSHMLYIQG